MTMRLFALGLILAAIAGAAFAIFDPGDADPEEANLGGDYFDFLTAPDLVRAADLIVVAEFLIEREERVDLISPVTGASAGFRDDVLRSYRIKETVKGEEESGLEIVVWGTRHVEHNDIALPQVELNPAEAGKTYVLFLKENVRNGEPIWAPTGEPRQAELVDDDLRFQTTAGYRNRLSERDQPIPPGQGAPFTLTLPELRQLALSF
jgi:hypothetical protein